LSPLAGWRAPRIDEEARMSIHVLWVIVHFLAIVVFVNRYIAGIALRVIKAGKWDQARDDYEPTVTCVVPMYNEGAAIRETLQSLVDTLSAREAPDHLRRRLLHR
jgi:hypothetical protein